MDGQTRALLIAGVLIFVMRLTALVRGWSAPRPGLSGAEPAPPDR